MLNNFLTLIWIVLVICIFYFWKKKLNRKYMWGSIIGLIALTFLIGSLPQNKPVKDTSKSTEVTSVSSSSKSTSASSSSKSSAAASSNHEKKPKRNQFQKMILKHRAGNLELGTSKSDVEKKLGKPDQDDGQIVLYDNFKLYFENSKLVGGDLPAIQKKVDKKIAKEKQERQEEQSKVTGFAQSFGRKPVDAIQSMPSVYRTTQDDNGNTVYGWHPEGLPELVRVDSANNNTDVYLYDEHGKNNMLGEHLYHGRTIYQKQQVNNNGYDY
ncbi:ECF transporter S component [Limosilactobacillus reuteri subsp. suis]|uniref:ECF transporter S component n=1 Tax=Limosilactobacillus reuteri TaxID=1598 RepID=UPI003993401E